MDCTASLDLMGIGRRAKISSVTGEDAMRQRLMELGFTPGAEVIPLYRAVSGDPTAYWIRGTVIALRAIDAVKIDVVPEIMENE